jgi:Txe/YoeB family toxin of Txe-Axe toxin-antitoxin module
MRNIAFTPKAYSDYIDWLKTDKKLFIKITSLIREAAKTPGEGSGKPELLIVRLRDGRWAAIEVKLGKKQIDEAAKNLLALKARIDEDKMGKASFLMVITGGQYAYRRNDGVLVVPLGCLKN